MTARPCTLPGRRTAAALACLMLAGCGGQRVEQVEEEPALVPAAENEATPTTQETAEAVTEPTDEVAAAVEAAVESNAELPVGETVAVQSVDCVPPQQVFDEDPLLERTQKQVYQVVYHSSRWFDGLFGSSDVQCAGSVSRGYVGPGVRWDQRDGFRGQFRFRADIALPAISDRANLIIGRVDTNDFVDGTSDDNINSLPTRFNQFNEQDLVLGVGFNNVGGLRNGWDFSVGIKVRTPPEPYARLRYHWNPIVSDRWLWRITPMAFAQANRGEGFSLNNVIDFAPSDKWLFRWWAIGTVEDEVEGTAWTGKLTAFQSLEDQRAIGYSIYASGETENEVELLDYGFEIRYRRSLWRPWFFVELTTSLSWPREFLEEVRESNLGVGVEFNLFFGEDYGITR
ncbi:MAG: hypothetical protein AAFX10_05615 [Pseudomonadota bacterium]